MIGILVPSSILLAGVIDDLKTRKIHNWLVLSCAFVALVSTFWSSGFEGLIEGGLAFALALLITLPLVLVGALGAGDMKLMMAFGLSTTTEAVVWTIIYSLIWGALLGVLRSFLQGEGKKLILNVWLLLRLQKIEKIKLHTMPYSVALFFGWLTYLSLTVKEGLI